jgi:MFS family permease
MEAGNDPISLAPEAEPSAGDNVQEKRPDSAFALHAREEAEYATGLRLVLVMFTVLMSTILTALEIGIISTAIPSITDEFNKINDVGWYASATFTLACASSPMWGKVFKYVNVTYAYVASITLYLVGSIVAATAQNSAAVVVGRAIQGLGGAGTLSGSVLIINYLTHPRRHPLLIGTWFGIFMVSTIVGPVIGGAFTSGLSWRWCFWINLVLGAPVLVLIVVFLQMPKHIKPPVATWTEIILQLDLPGFSLLLASLICFTLALQWGGQTKAWNEGSIIATLVLFVSLSVIFIGVEWLQGARAMVPLRLLKPRMTWANALYSYL